MITTGTYTIRDHIAELERRLREADPARLAEIEQPIGLYTPVEVCIEYAFALEHALLAHV